MTTRAMLLLAALTWAGCATDDGDEGNGGGGKGDTGETCEDPQYGDGTCQVALACGIPDIDCFQSFASDAEAATWVAQAAGVVTLPETDPLYVRARDLTDRAWEAYKAQNHLGELAKVRMSAVVVQNEAINAWVIGVPDATKVAVTVHYHSAILAPQLSDEEILAVVFHELAHVTKLHVLPEVYEKTQRFYVASGGEPLGAFQMEDGRVRAHVKSWIDLAQLAGPYTRPELGDLPLGGNLGALFGWMVSAAEPMCPSPVADIRAVQNELAASVSWLDDDVVVTADQGQRIAAALGRLATCARTASPLSINALVAGDASWTSYFESVIPADERWLLDEQDGITALQILTSDRRGKLRGVATAFQRELGAPWTAARYFTTEEEADDMSVRVSRAQKFAQPGVAVLMHRMMDNAAPCDDALAKSAVPYGVRLDDDHHGTCWRIAHARQMHAHGDADATARRIAPEAERGPWTPTRPSAGTPMY